MFVWFSIAVSWWDRAMVWRPSFKWPLTVAVWRKPSWGTVITCGLYLLRWLHSSTESLMYVGLMDTRETYEAAIRKLKIAALWIRHGKLMTTASWIRTHDRYIIISSTLRKQMNDFFPMSHLDIMWTIK